MLNVFRTELVLIPLNNFFLISINATRLITQLLCINFCFSALFAIIQTGNDIVRNKNMFILFFSLLVNGSVIVHVMFSLVTYCTVTIWNKFSLNSCLCNKSDTYKVNNFSNYQTCIENKAIYEIKSIVTYRNIYSSVTKIYTGYYLQNNSVMQKS